MSSSRVRGCPGRKPWSCAAMKPVSLRPLGETRCPSQNHHWPSGVSSTCGPRSRHSLGNADDQTSGGIAWMSRWSSAEINTWSAGRDMGSLSYATLRAAPETEGQVVQAADDEALDVRQGARVHQAHVVEPREEPFEADARFGACEAGPDTEVFAVTEGDVAPGVLTPCIEAVRIFEEVWVAVRGTDHRHRDRPRGNVDAGEFRIAQGQTEGALDRTFEAQALLDEVRDQLGIAPELRGDG